jgi:site-specific recombinase XerD
MTQDTTGSDVANALAVSLEDDEASVPDVEVLVASGVDDPEVIERALVVSSDDSIRRAADRRQDMLRDMIEDDAVYRIAVTLLRGTGTDASRLRYASDLRIFLTWMGEKGMDPRAATRDDLIDYIDSIKHYKVTSQRRLVTVARLFYRELEVRAMLPGPNPTLMLPKIRGKADEQPAGFSEKEAASLLSEIDAKIKSDNLVEHFLAVRDYAIVYLALTSGLRESELVGLKCADIHQERSIYWVVQVHGKGRKDRIVKIRDRAVEVINAYKEQMATLGVILGDDDPLFIRIGPKAEPDGAVPMGTRNLRKLVGKWLEVATLNGPRKGPHQLRRTAATIAYENGAPVDVVSDMLGHADLRTTRDNYIKPVDRLKHSASDHIHL